MESEPKIRPKVVGMADLQASASEVPPGIIATMFNVEEAGSIGLYFMQPGQETVVWSMEDDDDGKADEWYGHCHEFYYVLVGEFTVWWGKDAAKIKNKDAERSIIREGECAYYPPGWKYLVKNTGKVPGTFFWGMSAAPKGTKPRERSSL